MQTRLVVLAHNEADFKSHALRRHDSGLWNEWMERACRARAKVFLDEGLIKPNALTQDGRLTDRFDPLSVHFLSCDGDQVVGCMRMLHLNVNGSLREGYLEHVFRSLKLDHHREIYDKALHKSLHGRQGIVEFSRLAVDENYRLFRNIRSRVALSLLAAGHFYITDNKVKHLFITRGNKYQTKNIYERMGFQIMMNSNGKPLEPFWKHGDMNDLMHMALEDFTDFFMRMAKPVFEEYRAAEVILPDKEQE